MIAVRVDTTRSAMTRCLSTCSDSCFRAPVRVERDRYAELQHWDEHLSETRPLVFGIEWAASWGTPLRALAGRGHHVVEVERPRRVERRAGKPDGIDALAG